jgi:hypothetical protein
MREKLRFLEEIKEAYDDAHKVSPDEAAEIIYEAIDRLRRLVPKK